MTKIKHNFNPMALRERHSASSRTNNYSSFWLDEGWDTTGSIFDGEEKKKGVLKMLCFFQSEWPSGGKPSEETKKQKRESPCKKLDGMNTLQDA